MNKDILENISKDLNIELSQAEATLKLLEDGNTNKRKGITIF